MIRFCTNHIIRQVRIRSSWREFCIIYHTVPAPCCILSYPIQFEAMGSLPLADSLFGLQ